MSVTITITVTADGAAEVRTGADVTEEAPPPSLVGEPGGTSQTEFLDAGMPVVGPPPLELAELGLGTTATAAEEAAGPPPEDVAVAAEEADTAEAPEPRPIEELE